MDKFTEHLESLLPSLQSQILDEFRNQQTIQGYRSAWEHFEDVIKPIFISHLQQAPLNIPKNQIREAQSKSVYPDLEITFEGNLYAIDIKSGEHGQNPWYDMGRLDTYEEKHIKKYAAEYCVTVRWSGRNPPTVIQVYIEPSYKSAGYKDSYKGVLYRPYDGKIRPKSWEDFDKGVCYWSTEEEFKQGLEIAKIHRQMLYIIEWYRKMNEHQRKEVQVAIAAIDSDQQIQLFGESTDDNPS